MKTQQIEAKIAELAQQAKALQAQIDGFELDPDDYTEQYDDMLDECHGDFLGLALNVDYSYYNIEQRLKLWGVIDGTESEKKLDAELDRYWDRLGEAVRYMIDRDHK